MAGSQDFGDAQAGNATAVAIILQHHFAEEILVHAHFRLFQRFLALATNALFDFFQLGSVILGGLRLATGCLELPGNADKADKFVDGSRTEVSLPIAGVLLLTVNPLLSLGLFLLHKSVERLQARRIPNIPNALARCQKDTMPLQGCLGFLNGRHIRRRGIAPDRVNSGGIAKKIICNL